MMFSNNLYTSYNQYTTAFWIKLPLYHCRLKAIYSLTTVTEKVKRNIAHKVLPLPLCKFYYTTAYNTHKSNA